MANPFDQFDQVEANPFDQFDEPATKASAPKKRDPWRIPRFVGQGALRSVAGMAEAVASVHPVTALPMTVQRIARDVGGPDTTPTGLANRVSIAPETRGERWAETAGEMVPNLLAPGGILAKAAAWALPTVGAEGGREIAESAGYGPKGQAVAKIAGGLAGGLVASARSGPRQPRATSQRPTMRENVAAMGRAGVTPDLATTSNSRGAAGLANAMAENPLAGIPSRGRMNARIGEVEASAGRRASAYGSPSSRGAAGERVQSGIHGYNERFSAKATDRYDQVFGALDSEMAGKTTPGASRIRPTATAAVLSEMTGGVQSKPIGDLVSDPNIKSIAVAVAEGRTNADIAFGDLRALRTWVRDAKANPELRQSIGAARLGRLEGALTEDIYANAAALGSPQSAARLRRTDQWYALGSKRIAGELQNFVGRGAYPKSGESTYDLVLRAASDKGGADTGRLTALRKSLKPAEWGEVAATVIDRMGKATAGAADVGPFSVGSFVTRYSEMSPQGRDIMFGTGAARRELDNLANVAAMVKRVERGANTSKSAAAMQAVATVSGFAIPGGAIPTATGLGAMALTGEMMTNPAVVRWLSRIGSAKSPQALQTTVQQLQVAAKTNPELAGLSKQSLVLLRNTGTIGAAVATTNSAAEDRQQQN